MKKVVLDELIELKLTELKRTVIPDENGQKTYALFDFCVEVVPKDERQSKHIDILEYLLDHGYKIRWNGVTCNEKWKNVS